MRDGKRSFTLVDVRNVEGCSTKFTVRGNTGVFTGTPRSAASKALTALCHKKNIKGQCSFMLTVRETTRGSNGKEFSYHITRVKYDKPVELNGRKYNYGPNKIRSVKNIKTSCKSGKSKSSGPMKGIRYSKKK